MLCRYTKVLDRAMAADNGKAERDAGEEQDVFWTGQELICEVGDETISLLDGFGERPERHGKAWKEMCLKEAE